MPLDQHARERSRSTIQHEIALHGEETVLGRPVACRLHALDQVAKSLGGYSVVAHNYMQLCGEDPCPTIGGPW